MLFRNKKRVFQSQIFTTPHQETFHLSDYQEKAIALVQNLPYTQTYKFNLGDELFNSNNLTLSSEESKCSTPTNLYLICDGRIRLLCQNLESSRQIPVMALGRGEWFGYDGCSSHPGLPYRAIAASSGCVSCISHRNLGYLNHHLPQLSQHLFECNQVREYLLFFKRYTSFQAYPSVVLRQILIPHLTKLEIAAGTYLNHLSSAPHSRFWLRSGQIISLNNRSIVPAIGDSWGYPHPIPSNWLAQTSLVIYQLNLKPWEHQIAPPLIQI